MATTCIIFSENQLILFRAVPIVKVNRWPSRVCRQSFTQDSLGEKVKITNP